MPIPPEGPTLASGSRDLTSRTPAAAPALSESSRTPIVIVLGMHRSGTSLTAGALHRLGVDMVDGDLAPDGQNPKGYFERWPIVELHNSILEALNSSWDALAPLPPGWWRDPMIAPLKRQLREILRQELSAATGLWGVKDPRIMRLLPLWLELCAELRLEPIFVFCLRDPGEAAGSLIARDRCSHEEAQLLWVSYHLEAFQHLHNSEWIVADYEDWFSDPLSRAWALVEYCRIDYRGTPTTLEQCIEDWVDPTLRQPAHATQPKRRSFARWLYALAKRSGIENADRAEVVSDLVRASSNYAVFSRLARPLAESATSSRRELLSAQSDRADLVSRLERQTSELVQKQEAEAAALAAAEELAEEAASLHARVAELETRLREGSRRSEAAEQAEKDLGDKVRSLESTIEQQSRQLADFGAEISLAHASSQKAAARIEALEGDLAQVQRDRSDLLTKLDAQTAVADEFSAETIESRRQAHELEAALLRSRERCQNAEDLSAQLAEQLTDRDRELLAARSEIGQLRSRLEEQTRTSREQEEATAAAQSRADAALAEALSLRIQLRELEGELSEQRRRSNATDRAAAELTERIRERDAQIEAQRNTIAGLEAELSAANNTADAANTRLSEIQSSVAAGQAERAELLLSLEQQKAACREQEKSAALAQSQAAEAFRNETGKLEAELAQARRDRAEAEAQKTRSAEQLQTTTTELTRTAEILQAERGRAAILEQRARDLEAAGKDSTALSSENAMLLKLLASSLRMTVPHVPAELQFDEAAYIARYPDVAISIKTGIVASAFEHWVRWGASEGRVAALGFHSDFY